MKSASLVTVLLALLNVRQLGPKLARTSVVYGLTALALLSLAVAGWRALELAFGPLLGPLIAALVLSLAAAALVLWPKLVPQRRTAPSTPHAAMLVLPVVASLAAPLALPLVKFLAHPKRLALLAAGAVGVAYASHRASSRQPPPPASGSNMRKPR